MAASRVGPVLSPAPPLGAEEVHLWHTRLPDAAALEQLPLDATERARTHRFRRPRDAARFAHARAFLRGVLARYLELSPGEVRFELGEHGKPMLPGEPPPLQFNLSHSGDLALCALSRVHPVGIDVEAVKELPSLDDVVRRHLTSRERTSLEAAGDARARLLAFYRIWTRKEALLKGIGVGFTWRPARLCVVDPEPVLERGEDPSGAEPGARGHAPPPAPERGELLAGWILHDLAPPGGFRGALAVRRGGMDLVVLSDRSPRCEAGPASSRDDPE